MSIVYFRQKDGREELARIWKNPDRVNVIHYSCESFYDRNPETSPRVTCIAIRNLKTGQTRSFSLHKCAEINGAQVQDKLDSFEKQMLEDFFNFVTEKKEYNWVHWNMRDESFGFQALEHRLKVLEGTPGILYNENDFVALHQSTLSKVDVLANLSQIAYENKLKTNATWWEMHGSSVSALISWVQNQPVIIILLLIGNLLWIISFFRSLIHK